MSTKDYFRLISAAEVEYNLVNLKQLTFEVTDACNLQCKYCGYGDLYFGYDKRESKYLSFSKAKLIIDYLATFWNNRKTVLAYPITYISFYGGEPLLNMPFIKKTVSYIESLNVHRKFIFSMTTNAMLLDRNMDYLVEKDFHLLISIDGDKEAQSYRVTKSGENSFDTVCANVEKLQKKYSEYFNRSVNFNSVLHSKNSVEGTFRFIKDKFGKEPTISELNNSEIREDRRDEYDSIYRNKKESIRSAKDYGKFSQELFLGEPETHDLLIFLHQYSGNVFQNYNSLFVNEDEKKSTPTGTCPPFSRKMFVTVNGKILQCERIDHAFSYGNITDTMVLLGLDDVASKFNSYLSKMHIRCEQCYRKLSCTQCLYYIPDISEDIPNCNGFMDKSGYDRYVSYCLNHLKTHPKLYKKLMTEVKVE